MSDIYDSVDEKDNQIIADIYSENAIYFKTAMDLLKTSYTIFPLGGPVKSSINSSVDKALLALYTQSFRLFRSIIVLCKSGLALEALIVFRSLLENTAYLLYISDKDSEKRLEHYLYSRDLSNKVAREEFSNYFPQSKIDLNQVKIEYENAFRYFKEKHGEHITISDIKKNYTLNAYKAIQEFGDLEKIYKTFHRYISSIGHSENLREFIKTGYIPNKYFLELLPSDDKVKICLVYAIMWHFLAMQKLNELFDIGKNKIIGDLEKEVDILFKNFRDISISENSRKTKEVYVRREIKKE